jgi:hypothetical protein
MNEALSRAAAQPPLLVPTDIKVLPWFPAPVRGTLAQVKIAESWSAARRMPLLRVRIACPAQREYQEGLPLPCSPVPLRRVPQP